jgi:hypothetical protein
MGVNATLLSKRSQGSVLVKLPEERGQRQRRPSSAKPTAGRMMREKRLKLNFKSNFAPMKVAYGDGLTRQRKVATI